jgi:hypothetical protein
VHVDATKAASLPQSESGELQPRHERSRAFWAWWDTTGNSCLDLRP